MMKMNSRYVIPIVAVILCAIPVLYLGNTCVDVEALLGEIDVSDAGYVAGKASFVLTENEYVVRDSVLPIMFGPEKGKILKSKPSVTIAYCFKDEKSAYTVKSPGHGIRETLWSYDGTESQTMYTITVSDGTVRKSGIIDDGYNIDAILEYGLTERVLKSGRYIHDIIGRGDMVTAREKKNTIVIELIQGIADTEIVLSREHGLRLVEMSNSLPGVLQKIEVEYTNIGGLFYPVLIRERSYVYNQLARERIFRAAGEWEIPLNIDDSFFSMQYPDDIDIVRDNRTGKVIAGKYTGISY